MSRESIYSFSVSRISRNSSLGLALACAVGFGSGCGGEPGPEPRTTQIQTGMLPIDQIYHSMQGPSDRVPIGFDELDWVTAVQSEVVDFDSADALGDEFFCHSQIQMPSGIRLMTMATGSEDIRFPEGFAMPVSDIVARQPEEQRALSFLGMILNNHEPEIEEQARVKVNVEYFRDSDFGDGPRPKKLYVTSLAMQVEDLDLYEPDPDDPPINEDVTTHCALVETPSGTNVGLHWLVPPGIQTTRKIQKNLVPVDGRVHFASAHLHNYGVYMRLTDLTDDKVLFQADVEHEPSRDQIANITSYSSEEGFPVKKDHVYEIEAVYNNTTDQDVDAMAMMFLYFNPEGNPNISYPSVLPKR